MVVRAFLDGKRSCTSEKRKWMAAVEDMVTLQKYHRRIGEVRVEAEGLKSQLK
ncbi:MAG: hypothetical protein R3C18_07275 [Planctomycetaceae bacterium]